MVALSDLWLPVLLSTVFVFIASSVLHMCLPIHVSDYAKLPAEDDLMQAMRDKGITRGSFVFPFPPSMKEMGSPEMLEKYGKGPVGFMTILPNGPPNMGKSLSLWFLYTAIVSFFVGYLGSFTLAGGATFSEVFRFTATVSILPYCVSNIVDSVWKGQSWSVMFKFIFDGFIYSMVTAAAFGWLWPGA
ncbi:MAG: hypothetical protein CMJ89_08430 [Planctomycetes bacterium]|nr:hypothetical protein [Planctomycetota bacterium]